MIYPRLRIAKNLLADDGVLVCAMDENEFDTLSLVLKEIWGESTYDHTCVTVVHNPRGVMGNNFSRTNEYAFFVYPKNLKVINDRRIEEEDALKMGKSLALVMSLLIMSTRHKLRFMMEYTMCIQ